MSDDDDADYIAELKKDISYALKMAGVESYPWELEGDIYVEGSLKAIVEVYLDWRSEIEELG